MSTNPFNPSTSGLQPNAGVVGTPGAIVATSDTTQTVATGSLVFDIPAQCGFGSGMWVSITDAGNANRWMWGTIQSYDGASLLTVNITNTNGSGTSSDWLIALAGAPTSVGPVGPTGPTGATGAAAGPVNGGARGLKVTNNSSTPNTKIDITANSAVMVNSSGTSVRASAVSVTIDLSTGNVTAAANGMDGEAPPTNGWIYTYLINNGATTAGLATNTSPLSGAPTLPAGYTSYVYSGAMFVDGSNNLMRTKQLGNKSHYVVTATTNTAALPTLANGSAGSTSTPTWVSVATGDFVPATANRISVVANGDVGGSNTTVIAAPNNSYGSSASSNPPPVSAATAGNTHIDIIDLESANIYWASGGTDGFLLCFGWEDYCLAA